MNKFKVSQRIGLVYGLLFGSLMRNTTALTYPPLAFLIPPKFGFYPTVTKLLLNALLVVLLVCYSVSVWSANGTIIISEIKPKHSNQCLDIHLDTSNVYQHACHGGDNQKFWLMDAGDGDYQIKAKHSNQCLDVNLSTGTIYQYPCHGGDNQKFKLVSVGDDYYEIKPKHSDQCLDIHLDTGNAYQYACHGGDNQKFHIDKSSSFPAVVSTIKPKHSGDCLDISYDTGNAYQHACHGGDNQKFWLINRGDGHHEIRVKYSNQCLDISHTSNAYQHACHGGDNQRFKLVSAGDDYYEIKPKHSNQCLDIHLDTGNAYQHACHGGDNQKFKVKIPLQPDVTIDSPASLITVGATPISISGRVNQDTISLTINGAPITVNAGRYSAEVNLREGHNTIVARVVDRQGNVATASISVSLDMTPPTITVESPSEGATLYSDKITVTGLINDIVRGTIEQHQANIVANGISGTVSNRSYSVKDIPLKLGDNTISLSASDQVGNTAQKTLQVRYKLPAGKHLQLISGQDQSVEIAGVLNDPLRVKVVDDAGEPVSGETVVFRVTQGSGSVAPDTRQQGRAIAIDTDANGQAQTAFRLGQRVGTANHKVRATITGYAGEVIFSASGLAKIGNKISVNSGNNQRGVVGQALPAPFVAVVTDEGANVVSGARVKFEVNKGGGHFQNNKTSYQIATDSDGRATTQFILGELQGLDAQRVTATLIDAPPNRVLTAGFSASAFAPPAPVALSPKLLAAAPTTGSSAGAFATLSSEVATAGAGQTRLSGVVLDNQDQPLQGVTLRIEGTTRQTVSDDQGRFTLTEVPVGPVHLIADGSTTQADGEYPSLGYQLVTIAGIDNPMAAPIYMVKLDIDSARYAGKEDISLTLDKFPGFQLDIAKGSVTFPDGAKEGFISVTPVNASAVPMAPPNGMQPQFIVTIQPTGTKFDPPAPLTLPNVDGHSPGTQVELYSYDHDLEEFVVMGLGTVSEDGTVIASNPGVGVVKAGWNCPSQPAPSGCVSGESCSFCKKSRTGDCSNNDCIEDLAKAGVPLPADQQTAGDCQTKTCSGSVNNNSDVPDNDVQGDCKKPGCVDGEAKDVADDGDRPTDQVCKKCSSGELVANESKNGQPANENQCCYNGEKISNTITDLSQCPNRVPKPDHTPGFNGCGGSGLSSAVPDNPMWVNFASSAYNALHSISDGDFTQSCNEHDKCYDECNLNKSKSLCDSSFGSSMDSVCNSDYSGVLSSVYLLECLGFSSLYESTVSAIDSFYDDAQSNACNCCQ